MPSEGNDRVLVFLTFSTAITLNAVSYVLVQFSLRSLCAAISCSVHVNIIIIAFFCRLS